MSVHGNMSSPFWSYKVAVLPRQHHIHRKRLRILELLRSGEKCACVLIEQLDMPQSSLSYHMKILCESGIVDSRPEGKWIYYTICEKGGGEAIALLKELLTLEAITEESNCCL